MKIRTVFFWAHLIGGVTAGIVILIMSLTGALLTYERQLIEWSDRAFRVAPSAEAQRLPVQQLMDQVTATHPDIVPTAVTVRAVREAPVTINAGQRTVYVDPYSAEVIGEPTTDVRRWMSELRAWHRWLAIEGPNRPVARAITGWSNAIFLFIVLSGMYLWLPRRWSWQNVKAVAIFKAGLSSKARDFNWHNVIGIWSAVPLALVVATAMPISFLWASNLIYRAVGETPPQQGGGPGGAAGRGAGPGAAPAASGENGAGREAARGAGPEGRGGRTGGDESRARAAEGPRGGQPGEGQRQPQPVRLANLDALFARAERQVTDWRSINLRLPTAADAPLAFAVDQGNGGQPQLRSTLTLDAATGDVVRWETFGSQSLGRRLRSWSRFTHTGEAFGLLGQTIAGLVSAGGVVLVYTGLALAWRRFFGRKTSAVAAAQKEAA